MFIQTESTPNPNSLKFLLNLDINNFDLIYQDNSEEIDNFFIKAISRLKNENN